MSGCKPVTQFAERSLAENIQPPYRPAPSPAINDTPRITHTMTITPTLTQTADDGWSSVEIALCILLILLFLAGLFFFSAGIAAAATTGGVLFISQQWAPLAIVGRFLLSVLSGCLGWACLGNTPPTPADNTSLASFIPQPGNTSSPLITDEQPQAQLPLTRCPSIQPQPATQNYLAQPT